MATAAQFAQRMKRLARNVERRAYKVPVAASNAILLRLGDSTPVDTGEGVSNWKVNIGAVPIYERIAARVPGTKGSTRGPNILAMLSEGRQRLQFYRGGSIWITNAADHISLINDVGQQGRHPGGHPAQGFAERAVASGVAATRGARLLRD